MARITVEDCLVKENNRFALVQLASKRTKQILSGSRPLLTEAKGNKAVVTALREIASGQVRFMTPEEIEAFREESARARQVEVIPPSSPEVVPSEPLIAEAAKPASDSGDEDHGETNGTVPGSNGSASGF